MAEIASMSTNKLETISTTGSKSAVTSITKDGSEIKVEKNGDAINSVTESGSGDFVSSVTLANSILNITKTGAPTPFTIGSYSASPPSSGSSSTTITLGFSPSLVLLYGTNGTTVGFIATLDTQHYSFLGRYSANLSYAAKVSPTSASYITSSGFVCCVNKATAAAASNISNIPIAGNTTIHYIAFR